MILALDFETYYDAKYQLKKLTTSSYIRDPRFEVIGVGIQLPATLDQSMVVSKFMEEAEFRDWVAQQDWSQIDILAHHAHFDGAILAWHYGIVPRRYYCSLAMGRALHGVEVGGSLAAMMAHYGVGEKGDEVVRAIGKRRKDFTSEEFDRYGDYCLTDVGGSWDIFQKMLPSFPESELDLIDQTVRMFTDPVFVADEVRLSRFLEAEQQRKQELLERIGADKSVLMSSDKLAEKFRELGVEPPTKPSPKTKEPIFAFAKSDAGMQDLLDDPRDEVRFLAEARVGVKSTINESRTARFMDLGRQNQRMPVYLKYAGAHTHRDAGGDKVNWQNLQRGGEIRKAVCAPDGYEIVVADSAQIEARTNAWLAGFKELIEAFAQNRDIYSEFATKAYGRPVDRKKNKDDAVYGFVGKVSILGLGFGMGWKKFAATLLAGAMGGPPVQFGRDLADQLDVKVGDFESRRFGKTTCGAEVRKMLTRLSYEDLLVHCAVADAFVRTYRAESWPIVGLWADLETLLQCAADGTKARLGPIRAAHHAFEFPDSLPLRYPQLERNEEGRWSYFGARNKGFKGRVDLYGGKLCENVVQKLARNVVFHQALEIQRQTGHRPALRTHDELVFVVPAGTGEKFLHEDVLPIMRTPPAWAAGLPLNAEGGVGRSYGDAK